MRTPALLRVLEDYYDEAPRASTSQEEIGPFTLFLANAPQGHGYYARPRLGLDVPIVAADVVAVRERQRLRGAPESLEWVDWTTPSLLSAARAAGLHVGQCPLLVLPDPAPVAARTCAPGVRLLDPDEPALGEVLGAVGAGFAGTDEFSPGEPARAASMMRNGLLSIVGSFDERGASGGGSHSPRGATTELTGISVLPRARRRGVGAAITRALIADARSRGIDTVFLSAQDDAVARIYERVGFVRIGSACIAEPVRVEFIDDSRWATWRDLRLRALQDSPSAFGSTLAREAAFTETDFRSRLGNGGPAVLAMAGPTPVGMGAGHRGVEGWLHVVAMWVDPAWRGTRVGHLILDSIVGEAEKAGLRTSLDVNIENPVARRVYERYGFVGTGKTRPLRPGAVEVIERMVLPDRTRTRRG